MKRWLSSNGYGVKLTNKEDVLKLRQKLIVTPKVNDTYNFKEPPSYYLYKRSLNDPDVTYIPKCFGLQHFGVPKEYNPSNGIYCPNLNFKGTLRDVQLQPAQEIINACEDPNRSGGILNLQCGGGKTVLGIYAACALKRKTLIIAHKDFLLTQWRERINEFAPDAVIGMIKANICDYENADIVLASIQCMSMKNYSSEILNQFGTMIVDEVHRSGTEVFSKALMCCTPRYSIGLSATVERKDGMENAFKWFVGDVVYSHKEQFDNVEVQRIKFKNLDQSYCQEYLINNTSPNMAKMINNIVECSSRNKLIVDIIVNQLQINPNRNVLLLSDRRGHLQEMKKLLSLQNIDSGFYMGGMKPNELEESSKKNVILATFSFASEGFDLPKLNTLILASPKSSIEQSVGRILRSKDESMHPLVFDICDQFSLFHALSKKRYTFYKQSKYKIINIKHDVNSQL